MHFNNYADMMMMVVVVLVFGIFRLLIFYILLKDKVTRKSVICLPSFGALPQ